MQKGGDGPFAIEYTTADDRKFISKQGHMSAYWATRMETHGNRHVQIYCLCFKEKNKLTLMQTSVPEYGPEFWAFTTKSLSQAALSYDRQVKNDTDSDDPSWSESSSSDCSATEYSSNLGDSTESEDSEWFPGVDGKVPDEPDEAPPELKVG